MGHPADATCTTTAAGDAANATRTRTIDARPSATAINSDRELQRPTSLCTQTALRRPSFANDYARSSAERSRSGPAASNVETTASLEASCTGHMSKLAEAAIAVGEVLIHRMLRHLLRSIPEPPSTSTTSSMTSPQSPLRQKRTTWRGRPRHNDVGNSAAGSIQVNRKS